MSDDSGSLLQDLAKMIPGYGAYVEQEARRNDDRLTRDFLCRRLQDCKVHLDRLGRIAADAGDLDAPAKTEALRDELDRAQRRLEAAVEGYAGWFGARNVDSDLLKKVADHDANLVSLVDQLDALLSQVGEAASLDLTTPGGSDIEAALARLHDRIARRSELLQNA